MLLLQISSSARSTEFYYSSVVMVLVMVMVMVMVMFNVLVSCDTVVMYHRLLRIFVVRRRSLQLFPFCSPLLCFSSFSFKIIHSKKGTSVG